MRIGIIGCGDIARKAYIPGCRRYANLELRGLADLDVERTRSMAAEHKVPFAGSVAELLARTDIDLVVNLTIPSAHADIDRQIIEAGKHAYSEKPLANSCDEIAPVMALAREKGLRLGCAPDTVLGAGIQRCRQLIDQGAIGRPLSCTAFMAGPGHESWHPSPEFYYAAQGGGPLYDMGPYYITALVTLLGPVQAVSAFTGRAWEEREITSEAKRGQRMRVGIDTQINASLRFADGSIGSLIMSFDTWKHHLPRLEIHGEQGSLSVPDPNTFGGPVLLSQRPDKEWQEQELPHPRGERGLGLAEMAAAIAENRPHRANDELAYHVQEVMDCIYQAGANNQVIPLTSRCPQPPALPVDLPWRQSPDEA